ncbi:MAG: ABC transporter permease [bacterium]
MKKLLGYTEFYVAIVILLMAAAIAIVNPAFLSLQNLFGLLKSFSVIGIMAVGILFVLILGGTPDVSFTAIAQMAEYAVVIITLQMGGNIILAFLMAAVMGTLLGSVNGFILHFFRVPTIIVSIATFNIYFGLLYVFSEGQVVYVVHEMFRNFADINVLTLTAANGKAFGLELMPIIWLAVLLLGWFILKHTTLGRNIYAIGGNETAARRVGINVFRARIFVFSFVGFLSGIAGVVHATIVQSAIPNSIVGKELDVIAAAVLGGASVFGGRGTVVGTFLGVALFAVMSNGLTLLRISSYWYDVLIGAVIMISITVNALQALRRQQLRANVNVEGETAEEQPA